MRKSFSLVLLLFVVFLDYLGMGLVFPLYAILFFDPTISFFAPEVGAATRGLWMGILIALGPLAQFFTAPLFGSLSDQRGRKPLLLIGLACGCVGFAIGIGGVLLSSLILLVFYRLLFGICAAMATVVQAALVDLSTPQTKGRYFAWYSMALGFGFMVGPYLGGVLSKFSLAAPFLFGLICASMNFILLSLLYEETNKSRKRGGMDWLRGVRQVRVAFQHPSLRIAFIGFFLFFFGWDYFEEFVGVYLAKKHGFSVSQIGSYYGLSGLYYAVFAGLIIPRFLSRLPVERILLISMLAGAGALLPLVFFGSSIAIWVVLPLLMLFGAMFFPMSNTFISNQGTADNQGELLGILQSINALALVVSPLFLGSLAGAYPRIWVVVASGAMLMAGAVFFQGLRARNKSLESPFERGES